MDREEPDQGIKPFNGEVTDSMIDALIEDDERSGVAEFDAAVSRVPATEFSLIFGTAESAFKIREEAIKARVVGVHDMPPQAWEALDRIVQLAKTVTDNLTKVNQLKSQPGEGTAR